MTRKQHLFAMVAAMSLSLFASACSSSTEPSGGSDPILPGGWVPYHAGTPTDNQANGISTSPGPRANGISTSPPRQ
jgi:hypothetical protein